MVDWICSQCRRLRVIAQLQCYKFTTIDWIAERNCPGITSCSMQQEAQVPQTKRDVYLELLSREGLCHWIDEDGDVAFWSSGHLFVLFPNERDRDLFQIAAPNIWTFGPDESERAFKIGRAH